MTGTATIRQCVVLAGAPADPLRLGLLMREMERFGVAEFLLLGGSFSGQARDAIAATAAALPRPAVVEVADSPPGAGALHAVRARLAERFILCDGPAPFAGNLATLLAAAAADPPEVVGRLLEGAPDGMGIGAFDPRLLDHLPPSGPLAAAGPVRTMRVAGWCDFADWPVRLRRPALFLDRDGVLNIDYRFVCRPDQWDWMPGAIEALRMALDRGWQVFVVTNQSGVARGLFTAADVEALMAWVEEALHAAGATVDDWRFCPFHPEGTVERYRQEHPWRKPAPGMLLDLMRAWGVDAAQSLMVGDAERDIAAGVAAGMRTARFPGSGNLAAFLDPLL